MIMVRMLLIVVCMLRITVSMRAVTVGAVPDGGCNY